MSNHQQNNRDQYVDLRPEGISDVYGLKGNLVIARDTLVENFMAGSGDDRIIGNATANHLVAGAGDDVLEGGAGADMLNQPGCRRFYLCKSGDRIQFCPSM